ncbi:carbonic anhydrase [Chengkuizengella axinellae]|uniref:carbonic anhydrase n=1 Tax=Chengkuizengella axinellae TaxID=3064388 RepID=A0ABT9J4V9_9BACL|nr:carbonic anhydrase [Chengkuizengella sp. 2205SS18-9]MDP5276670.1 carbonic anhydrase [Chengkuizengella sp. 2205SS18-9]
MKKELNLSKQNEQFILEMKKQDPIFFSNLSQGQSPEYFVLACSDSRVSPSITANMPLGHFFVHRNVANQVVESDDSFSAGLYYALKHLQIKKIIIEGHTNCGGIDAACKTRQQYGQKQELDQKSKDSQTAEEGIMTWISEIQKNLHVQQQCKDLTNFELVKLNVLNQIENVKEHPVYKKYGESVEISGYVFDLSSGKLIEVAAPNPEAFN